MRGTYFIRVKGASRGLNIGYSKGVETDAGWRRLLGWGVCDPEGTHRGEITHDSAMGKRRH